MNCINFYYGNTDGKRMYGVKLKKEIKPDDINVYHEDGKSNNDVEVVQFSECNLSQVPQGLTKIFPNLIILDITNSNLKSLSKLDLAEYKNLRGFYCELNQPEFLPGDLFEDFKNLEWISFRNNKLKVIEPTILDGLDKLKYVDFRNNHKFTKFFSTYGRHNNYANATLQQVKRELAEQFVDFGAENVKNYVEKVPEKTNKPELDLNQKIRELSDEIQILKDENLKLTKQNQTLKDNNLFDDLKSHIADENFKDFKIEIDGREFHVHKFLLAARSPTLAEMLRNNPEAENLKLVDIPIEVFGVILKFLYNDELPQDDGTNFLHLFAAASRLKIDNLANYASLKILHQINGTNAVDVLDLGNKYGHDGLRQRAFEEVMKKFPMIKFNDDVATDTEKVKKMIDYFKELEAVEKKLSTLMD